MIQSVSESRKRVASLPDGLWLRLRDGVTATETEEGRVLQRGDARMVVDSTTPGIADLLQRLGATGGQEGRLAEIVRQKDGTAGLGRFYYLLNRLAGSGLLVWSAVGDGKPLATLTPISPACTFSPALTGDSDYVLSRFALLRRIDDEMVIESPLAHARVALHDPRVATLLHALASPRGLARLRSLCPDVGEDALDGLIGLLAGAGLVVACSPEGTAEDKSPALMTWEFHDLLFHSRSRVGRHDCPRVLYRLGRDVPPPPAIKRIEAKETVSLYRPDLSRLEKEDPPFAHVQESRKTIRSYGARPIQLQQLGEFLYRVARVREQRDVAVETEAGTLRTDVGLRPYPGGGGMYELELYAAVECCEGLGTGLYHYDPVGHRLGRLSGRTRDVEHLLAFAKQSTATPGQQLQVLIVVAARFQRIAWKYASVAYSLILKHVGILFQTMYLSATAMGLAPCALGAGDADRFARAIGTDYFAETSVGEFLLGSAP